MLLVVSSSFPRVSTSVPRGRKHCAVNIVGNLIGIIGIIAGIITSIDGIIGIIAGIIASNDGIIDGIIGILLELVPLFQGLESTSGLVLS